MKPHLPKLVIRQFKVQPVFVKEYAMAAYAPDVEIDIKLFYLYGAEVANDWRKLNLFERNDIHYFARVSSTEGALRKKHFAHFPEDQSSGLTVFLNSDDLVMLSMLAPRAVYTDFSKLFAN